MGIRIEPEFEKKLPPLAEWEYRRGEVYLADLDPYRGSEQGGTRPVLVLQNNVGNIYCPTLIVAPITSRLEKKPNQPTHCLLGKVKCLPEKSMVMLEQIRTIDKSRVIRFIGRLKAEKMREIDAALEVSLGLHITEEVEAP